MLTHEGLTVGECVKSTTFTHQVPHIYLPSAPHILTYTHPYPTFYMVAQIGDVPPSFRDLLGRCRISEQRSLDKLCVSFIPPGCHMTSHLAEPPSRATWQSHLAEPLGRATWQSHLAEPPGRATWQSHLAEPPGRATWQSHLTEPPDGAT